MALVLDAILLEDLRDDVALCYLALLLGSVPGQFQNLQPVKEGGRNSREPIGCGHKDHSREVKGNSQVTESTTRTSESTYQVHPSNLTPKQEKGRGNWRGKQG